MACEWTSERLPWLLTGALEADETLRVRAHLELCAACRRDLEETRAAASVFGTHLPAAALVQLAWDQPLGGIPLDVARRHVESCATCAEELALARQSRRLEATPDVPVRALPQYPRVARFAGLVAGLAATFVAGVLWQRLQLQEPLPDPSQARLMRQLSALESENQRLTEGRAAVERQFGAPQLNLPILELSPLSETTRSARSVVAQLDVPPDVLFVALLLNADAIRPGPATIEIRDAKQAVVWKGEGLRPGSLGGYTLGIPAALLADGRYSIGVRSAAGGSVASYALQVQRRH